MATDTNYKKLLKNDEETQQQPHKSNKEKETKQNKIVVWLLVYAVHFVCS